MKTKVLLAIFLLHSAYRVGQSEPLVPNPVRVPVISLRSGVAGTCPSHQDTIQAMEKLRRNISTILETITGTNYSCGGTTGWRRVGYLDMTDPSQSCPPGLALKTYSPGLRSCGRVTNVDHSCWPVFYNTGGFQYSRVCGRVRGYQFGFAYAFYGQVIGPGIDSHYVSGVSLTHGQNGSRTHIWTFATSLSETYDSFNPHAYCPCVTAATTSPPPAFVGNDYFCESGRLTGQPSGFYARDPLWDGQNCASCCQLNDPPYFTKTLPAPTNDDIELRLCTLFNRDDTPIDQVELYVQ